MKTDPHTYAIIGAAMEVHRTLGRGFLELVYRSALAREFTLQGIPFQREAEIVIEYKGAVLDASFRVDFVCYGNTLVELKALDALTGKEQSQALNYLRATSFPKCLLINFGAPRLEYERYVGPSASSLEPSVSSVPSVDLQQ